MRTSVDVLNYFRRRKQARKYKRILNKLLWQIHDLRAEFQNQKDWRIMYSDLIETLQNVPKYCALKEPKKIKVRHPLEHVATYETNICIPSQSPVLQHIHIANMCHAEAIIEDYVTKDLIHLEIETAEGKFAYQYSKQGIAIQPFKKILKEVTWLLTRAWFNQLHPKKG